jgi:MFS family permease
LWRPLRVSTFRNLLVADVVADVGAFMQNVGAAWLMVSLGAGPIYVALTQTAASLPYFLLALPAGSAGDIFDRHKLVLATETWMMGIALLLAVLTISGFMSPWLLLVLTFALSAGDAFETPDRGLGAFAQRASVRTALVYAGIGTIANIAVTLFTKLPDSTAI